MCSILWNVFFGCRKCVPSNTSRGTGPHTFASALNIRGRGFIYRYMNQFRGSNRSHRRSVRNETPRLRQALLLNRDRRCLVNNSQQAFWNRDAALLFHWMQKKKRQCNKVELFHRKRYQRASTLCRIFLCFSAIKCIVETYAALASVFKAKRSHGGGTSAGCL